MVLGYFPWSGRGPRSGCKETDDQAWPSVHCPLSTIINTLAAGGWPAGDHGSHAVTGHQDPPRPRNYPGLVPPRPALRPRVSQGGTLASKHPIHTAEGGVQASAGQDTPGVGQCQHKLGLRLSIKAEDGRHRDHLGWRGGPVQALGNFVEIHNPMICMFRF